MREPPSFARLRAVACYAPADEESNPLGIALRALKYAKRRAVAATLSAILADRFPFDPRSFDVIAPVPLSLARLRERGFNQAALLAREPARRYAIPRDPGLLVRLRDTPPQVGLPLGERLTNVSRAFAVRPGRVATDLRVLLVDDVSTSTATAESCARALRAAGARSVDVLVVARALVR